jgi:hypothetical protein
MHLERGEATPWNPETRDVAEASVTSVPVSCDLDGVRLIENRIEDRLVFEARRKPMQARLHDEQQFLATHRSIECDVIAARRIAVDRDARGDPVREGVRQRRVLASDRRFLHTHPAPDGVVGLRRVVAGRDGSLPRE